MTTDKDLSQHRHISFTAHYTGYIWYKMGISHAAFATNKGKSFVSLLSGFETLAEKYVGGSMRSTLKQRHEMLDEQLEVLIAQHPDLQVLEIASGLSPRGWWFRQKYPHINFRELDLPDMAAVKNAALAQCEPQAPQVFAVDLFHPQLAEVFAAFDPKKPLVIMSEGLVNYFDLNMLQQLMQTLVKHSQPFVELHYLTDIYPEPVKNKLANFIWSCSKLLKFLSRSAFSFHFAEPQAAEQFMLNAGFNRVTVLQPKQYFAGDRMGSEREHSGDLVWMIHAKRERNI